MGAAALAPLACFAQQPGRVWRVGFLTYRDPANISGSFTQGMRELGYFEGRNLVIEWRSAQADVARLPQLAAELVRLKVDVLVAQGTPASQAAQKATRVIPIVMNAVGDPVGTGLVKSLARPGGNSTALSIVVPDLGPKLLGMLREVLPKVTRVAILVNPANDGVTLMLKTIQSAAPELGFKIQSVEASTPEEIARGFAVMARQEAQALVVAQDGFLGEHKNRIAELALEQRLPSISSAGYYAQAGGLLGYGTAPGQSSRRAAAYVDKILRGAAPGDIPVEQPTTFELVINRKTALALGITFPQSILTRATTVIE
jgi:putative ABC transport system substrate-binding protein